MSLITDRNGQNAAFLSIRRSMILGAVAIVAGLAIGAGTMFSIGETYKIGSNNYQHIIEGKDFVSDILPPPLLPYQAMLIVHALDTTPADKLAAAREQVTKLHKDYDASFDRWSSVMGNRGKLQDPKWKSLFDGMKSQGSVFWSDLEQKAFPAAASKAADKDGKVAEAMTAFYALERNVNDSIDFINGDIQSETDANVISANWGMYEVGAIFGLVLALVAALAVLGQKFIVKSITNLSEVMSCIARGNLETEIPYTERRDEIGDMSRAVEVFKQAGLEKIRLESEAADERRRNALVSKDMSEQQNAVMELLALGLSKLSLGDLTFRLNDVFPSSYEKLRNDFNTAISTLEASMINVIENAAAIRGGASEISIAAVDLSKRTEQQAASLEETAAALDQITKIVAKSAEGAKSAQDIVAHTRNQAQDSGHVVDQTVGAMRGIEASSAKVGQIVGLIDEIAFQTNLLALNAGVEAARAGDAGRGFAVVAQEVRALAQRSATAAKEIKTLVEESKNQIGTGVELVDKTGRALADIISQINTIDNVVVEMSASARDQASSLVEVNSAVTDMDRAVQQNAAMVEESTAASQSLANEAGNLDALMGQFAVSAATSKPAPRPAASPVHAARSKLASAFSAPAPAKAVGNDWSDF